MCLKIRKLCSLDTTYLDKFNLSWKNNVVVLIIEKVLFTLFGHEDKQKVSKEESSACKSLQI